MHKFGKKENNQREDRRIRRTKNLLKQALIELILEKEYEDISVQSIIDRADVGRTSFYAHFRNKEDLLLQNLDDLEDIFKPQGDKEHDQNINDFSLMILRHIEENWKLARLLLGNPKIQVVQNHMQAILLKIYKSHLRIGVDNKKTSIEIEGAAVVFSAALLSLILWWLSMKKPVSHDIMHELFLKHIRNI